MTIKVLGFGQRDFADETVVARGMTVVLDIVMGRFPKDKDIKIIQGKAPGADSLVAGWGNIVETTMRRYGYMWEVKDFPAKWKKFGTAAGPIRNKEMLDYGPHIAAQFQYSNWPADLPPVKGTRDMARQLKEANIETHIFYAVAPEDYLDKLRVKYANRRR